jgi:hypothetical protein
MNQMLHFSEIILLTMAACLTLLKIIPDLKPARSLQPLSTVGWNR